MTLVLRFSAAASPLAFVLLLGACGGSSRPISSPAPSASPTPTAPIGNTSFPLTASDEFQSIVASRVHVEDSRGKILISESDIQTISPSVTVGYDQGSGSYTLRRSTGTVSVNGDHRISSSGLWRHFKTDSGVISHEISIYGKSPDSSRSSAGQIDLTYLSVGKWRATDNTSGQRQDSYFLFGFPTTSQSMPKTGTARYNTLLVADAVDTRKHTQGEIAGTASFSADFGAGTVHTSLHITAGTYSGNHTYSGIGTIFSGNRFEGQFIESSDRYFREGDFAGGFFGPDASEMGYSFSLWLTVDRNKGFPGVSDDYPNTRIVGAVVGTK